MNKKEVLEIRKHLGGQGCSVSRIAFCYVDAEKNQKLQETETFLSMPEDEILKYQELFKKGLSGNIGKNLVNLAFPSAEEKKGGSQELFLKLRDSKLRDEDLLNNFYQQVIDSYVCEGNYLMILACGDYDVPVRGSDGTSMDDASEEAYRYLYGLICPVDQTKPGLSYGEKENRFKSRYRDWAVGKPEAAFLFPSFNDRGPDIHEALYYSKDAKDLHAGLIDGVFRCPVPMTSQEQADGFSALVDGVLGDGCNYETLKNVHDSLIILKAEADEAGIETSLDKNTAKRILENAAGGKTELAENAYAEAFPGDHPEISLNNITHTKGMELETDNISIRVSPDRTSLVEERKIDGRRCLVVFIEGDLTVNGVKAR